MSEAFWVFRRNSEQPPGPQCPGDLVALASAMEFPSVLGSLAFPPFDCSPVAPYIPQFAPAVDFCRASKPKKPPKTHATATFGLTRPHRVASDESQTEAKFFRRETQPGGFSPKPTVVFQRVPISPHADSETKTD
jgi:hypothetical protein